MHINTLLEMEGKIIFMDLTLKMVVLLHVKSINLQTTTTKLWIALDVLLEVVVVNCQEAVKITATVVVVAVINYQYSIGYLTYKNQLMKRVLMVLKFALKVKEFYNNSKEILQVGDVVAVQSKSGHDVGVVTIVGALAKLQMRKKFKTSNLDDLNIIYRKAKDTDIQKWKEAVALENETMYGARKSAELLGLEMKISDVEYQGDKSKATFYYTANGRVDFRELIKSLSSQFKIRIEMRQIGARQEAARLGGIGACGRELCCSSWLTDFRSAQSTSAARYQQLSINPQKLAGQCGKLKCCLNYELDGYMKN